MIQYNELKRNVEGSRQADVETGSLLLAGTEDKRGKDSVDKKNQLDATFCIFYFSSNSCSTCFGQPCAHHQELTTA